MKGGSIWTRNSRADGLDGRWLDCGLIDRYDQASRLGNLTGLALFLAAVAWFMTYPLFFAETVVPLDDPFQITVEILDLPPPQPEPEEILREP
ncbi:MAG: hypothetical protein LBJ64_12855, partial [Deltaproteobacteria bacterium]|nr:hypothetical protein [Deltaproteobacteria bacterium]